jgi:hypothetical protein
MSILTWPVRKAEFDRALTEARETSERIRKATSSPEEMPTDALYVLAEDRMSGYGVTQDGELIGVFSLIPGRGAQMISEAIMYEEASKLDCFDGFLPGFYARFGFVEYRREANWTEGGPDVVYMRLDNMLSPLVY